MTRSLRALLLTLPLIVPFVVLRPHASDASPWTLTRDEARSVICFDGSLWPCEQMLDIASRESGLQPGAVNRDCGNDGTYRYVCWGLLQVLSPCECGLLDPYENVYRAYEKYINGGVAVHWRNTQ